MKLALAALIAAYHESAEPGFLRATLPLAGRTLIERQARIAAAAGASRIVIVVERMPAELSAAVDRLRADLPGLSVARSAEEAAEAIDASDRLLLVADGAVLDAEELDRLALAEGPAVLTVPDAGYGELHERIDAESRWGGLVAMEGSLLRETATMLRDWDLQSTLLRRALQKGARHVAAERPVAMVDGRAQLAALEQRILLNASESDRSWAARMLAPLERLATHYLMDSPIGAPGLGLAASVLGALAITAFVYHFPSVGIGLLILATPLEGLAMRLAHLRMQDEAARGWWTHLLPVLGSAALIALAYALAPEQGWGMVLMAFMTIAFLIALGIETEGRRIRGTTWLAERRGMIWIMLPFAIFDLWGAGVATLFAYAAGSFFWAQREAHRRSPARQD